VSGDPSTVSGLSIAGAALTRSPAPHEKEQSVDEQRPEPEIEVVRSFLKTLEAPDLESALSYLADGVAYQNMPLPHYRCC